MRQRGFDMQADFSTHLNGSMVHGMESSTHGERKKLLGGSLAERIDEACHEAGVNTTQLAAACDVTFAAAARWRKGRSEPHGKNLRRIAEVCRVSVDELLGVMDGQEPPFTAWRQFALTEAFSGLSASQRKFVARLPWPEGQQPTLAAYLIAAEMARLTEPR
jgi:transcriptional regulator with XRE-family HTH domain